jgi:hypothetical protein
LTSWEQKSGSKGTLDFHNCEENESGFAPEKTTGTYWYVWPVINLLIFRPLPGGIILYIVTVHSAVIHPHLVCNSSFAEKWFVPSYPIQKCFCFDRISFNV